MSPARLIPVAACIALLAAMPVVFRRSVGALATSAGLSELGDTVALLDSLRSEGWVGAPPLIVLRAGLGTGGRE